MVTFAPEQDWVLKSDSILYFSTAAKTEMALGVTKREFVSIQDRCRAVILRHLNHEDQIEDLELPRTLKRFITEG